MKADLDRLMAQNDLDVIFVYGGEEPNTYRRYLMNGVEANAHVFKKRGQPPVALVNPMELDEAKPSGLQLFTPHDLGLSDLRKQYKDTPEAIFPATFSMLFDKLGLKGRVAVYGTADVYQIARLVHEVLPTVAGVELVTTYPAEKLFQEAYQTKDAHEIEQLKQAARLTCEVMTVVRNFISSHHANENGVVVDAAGQALTIGAIKRLIRRETFERGMENSDGLIFAQGRDAGMPHSQGDDAAPLRTGQSIVFDFFPRLTSSGYFHDVTRTWALGHALPEVQMAYDHVLHAFNLVDDALKVGDDPARYQAITCDWFESQGHKTSRSDPGTMEGYVHSLGHGVGLNIHEAPHLSNYSLGESLAPGNVFTVEPGLYYPEQGFGVRIEDTLYIDEHGTVHHLTDFPYDLVVPLNGK